MPAPLLPRPPIEWTPEPRSNFNQALLALGQPDSVSTLLPDTSLFLYMYVRKEAVLSSILLSTPYWEFYKKFLSMTNQRVKLYNILIYNA